MSNHLVKPLLINSLKNKQNVVLVIGDKIPLDNDEYLIDKLRDHLTIVKKTEGLKSHEGDFFYFENKAYEGNASQEIKEFYDRLPIPEFYHKIAKIPFPLIIQFSPDKFLYKVFGDNSIATFGHFNKSKIKVEQSFYKDENYELTADQPIVYNLLGTIDDTASMVYTYNHLFDYLKTVFNKGENPIPELITNNLKEAPYFVFIGFRYEQWHYKLLLYLLNRKNEDLVNDGICHELNNGTKDYYEDNCGISFTKVNSQKDVITFINELYDVCKDKGILRPLKKNISPLLNFDQPMENNVFISYSHKDKEIANRIKEYLQDQGIEVTIDSEVMLVGEDIEAFIERAMQNTNVTLSLISENSLLSAWVALESMNSLNDTRHNRKFIPVAITNSFFQRSFVRESISNVIRPRLREIIQEIEECHKDEINPSHLHKEQNLNIKLRDNLSDIVKQINEKFTINISDENFDTGMLKVVNTIKKKDNFN